MGQEEEEEETTTLLAQPQGGSAGKYGTDDGIDHGEHTPPSKWPSIVLWTEGQRRGFLAYFTCRPGSLLNPSKEDVMDWVRATIALHGTVIFWIGGWGLLSKEETLEGDLPWAMFECNLFNMSMYTLVGFVLCWLMDTLYSNVAMDTPLNPREGLVPPSWRWWMFNWRNKHERFLRYALRTTIAMVAMILLWIGIYNLMEYWTFDWSIERDLGFLFGGLALLYVTDTLTCFTSVFPGGAESSKRKFNPINDPSKSSNHDFFVNFFREEGIALLRCIVSLVGTNMVWNGSWNLMHYYPSTTMPMLIGYWLGGLGCLVVTGSYVSGSWIDTEAPSEILEKAELAPILASNKRWTISIAFHIRLLVALAGQVMMWGGAWEIIDENSFDDTPLRNVCFFFLGLLLCMFSGTVYTNAGVVPAEYVFAEELIQDERVELGKVTRAQMEASLRRPNSSAASTEAKAGADESSDA